PLTFVWAVPIGTVLITSTLPKKKKKKNLFCNTHQTEHVQSDFILMSYQ
ncbi:unnamed protein product, partial [Staurois parvus]